MIISSISSVLKNMSRTKRTILAQLAPQASYGKKYLRRPRTTQEIRMQEFVLDQEEDSPVRISKPSRIIRHLPNSYDDLYISAWRELSSKAQDNTRE